MKTWPSVLFLLFSIIMGACQSVGTKAEQPDYKKHFADREACFLMVQLSSGKTIAEWNRAFCKQRRSPNSSFKIAAALMAFDSKTLADENQNIPWDKKKRSRSELNQDQTPISWMEHSAVWVTQWIAPQLGEERISKYLRDFGYGNQDFSGGPQSAWLDSSLKISPEEQLEFQEKLWTQRLPVSKTATEKTKRIMLIKDLNEKSQLYGKTGTGCITDNCEKTAGLTQGWFVGAVRTVDDVYIFSSYAIDRTPHSTPAGPRLRDTITKLLSEFDQLH